MLRLVTAYPCYGIVLHGFNVLTLLVSAIILGRTIEMRDSGVGDNQALMCNM